MQGVGYCDDSPRLQDGGECPDTGMSSHTIRSVQPHERAMLTTTHVSVGTIVEHGRVFTHRPARWNPAKRDSVANVQKNYVAILFVRRKAEIPSLPDGSAAFIPPSLDGGLPPRDGNPTNLMYNRKRKCSSADFAALSRQIFLPGVSSLL